jgi:hypothetical protein
LRDIAGDLIPMAGRRVRSRPVRPKACDFLLLGLEGDLLLLGLVLLIFRRRELGERLGANLDLLEMEIGDAPLNHADVLTSVVDGAKGKELPLKLLRGGKELTLKVTPEKRIPEAIRALAAIRGAVPDAHLLLAGEAVEHYDPMAVARAQGIESRVTVAGFVADEDIDDYLAASDVCLCMRWPSSRETSASWLRCIAAGRPTITTDLVHTADLPALDPQSWTVRQGEGASPVTVSIDILDEDHSLRIAMQRLATDARLRATVGHDARALWNERFRLDQMASRYREAIDRALTSPAPDASSRARLPKHLLQDGTEHTERLLRDAGLTEALRRDLWIGRSQ